MASDAGKLLQPAHAIRVQVRAIVNIGAVGEVAAVEHRRHRPKETVKHVRLAHHRAARAMRHTPTSCRTAMAASSVIPYFERFSLIGTTDVAVTDFDAPQIGDDETRYLLNLVTTTYLAKSDAHRHRRHLRRRAPLYDDGDEKSVCNHARLR